MTVAIAMGAARAAGQDRPVAAFWDDERRSAAGGAAEVVGIRDPFAVLALRLKGKEQIVWGAEPEPVPQEAPALDRRLLRDVLDHKPLPNVAGRLPDEWKPWEAAIYKLYCQAIRYAKETPAEAFARSAQQNRTLTWGHLFREPKMHRGKIVPIQGRLKMLREQEAPLPLQRDVVRVIYEAWIFTDTPGSNPVCVIVPDLPAGLEVGEKVDCRVKCDAYFLMRYRYVTGRGPRETLLLVAPTLSVQTAQTTEGDGGLFSSMSSAILMGMIGLIAGTILVVAALGWWFRRGDRRFQAHLRNVRAGMFNESELAAPPEPTSPPELPPPDQRS